MNTCTLSPYHHKTYAFPRHRVFNELQSIKICGTPTAEICLLADQFWQRIQSAPSFKSWLQDDKLRYWHKLVHSAHRAVGLNCCIRYRRDRRYTKATRLQVIDCAVEAGFFVGYRAKPGYSARSSRLLPSGELRQHILNGPHQYDLAASRQYVRMRRKADKVWLDFDSAQSVAAETQQKLEVVNHVLAGCRITYRPSSDPYAAGVCPLRPIHYRLFHENWQHGRIYLEMDGCGKSLRRQERKSIQFDGEPSVELDYGAMHPRMAYHLRGLEAPDDPYQLWSPTSEAQRELGKLVINTSLNADTCRAAIGACCEAIRLRTKKGARAEWKEGNRHRRALELREALCKTTGISPKSRDFFKIARSFFEETYSRAAEYHQPIACDFLSGIGRELMRVESSIALDVLFHFASKAFPILGVHDSFIVPQCYSNELREVMQECYQVRLGFYPIVK